MRSRNAQSQGAEFNAVACGRRDVGTGSSPRNSPSNRLVVPGWQLKHRARLLGQSTANHGGGDLAVRGVDDDRPPTRGVYS